MLSYEEIYKIVENKLSEERFYHSKCVVERCLEYGKIYGNVDLEKLKIAGIAHDIAKEIPKEQRQSISQAYGVQLDEVELWNDSLIHAKLGAAIAKKDFGCSDDICEAIKWHTTGKENMSLMEKIVFLADATSKDRQYAMAKNIYYLAKENLDLALIESMKSSMKNVLSSNRLLHLDSVKAYNDLVKENKNYLKKT